MNTNAAIALLDLDGTLIAPAGYRAAYSATMKQITSMIGLESPVPGDAIQEFFESLSVNSTWDMVGITAAILFEYLYQAHPGLKVAATSEGAIEDLRTIQTKDLQIDFFALLKEIGPSFNTAEIPPLGLLAATNGEEGKRLFPRLNHTPLLEELLLNTRDVYRSRAIQVLQTYVLGSEGFEQTYGLPAEFSSESLLEKNDIVLISDETRRKLIALHSAGEAHFSILTYRPSGPPGDIDESRTGYAVESEIAVSLLQMNDVPIIGYGRMDYLAKRFNSSTGSLMKPNPVQALAAIAAAWTNQEWPALEWAHQLFCESRSSNTLTTESEAYRRLIPSLPASFHLYVFEDTPTGILATQAAVEILERYGLDVSFHVMGIAREDVKQAALKSHGARIFPNFDQAFADFLHGLG